MPKGTAESTARLTIRGASDMSPKLRKEIASWLRLHAASVLKDGHNYSRVFTGRYFVA